MIEITPLKGANISLNEEGKFVFSNWKADGPELLVAPQREKYFAEAVLKYIKDNIDKKVPDL